MKHIILGGLLVAALASAAQSETPLTQQELAAQIYELSHIKRVFDDTGSPDGKERPISSLYLHDSNETYIKIVGCTAQFRWFNGPPDDPYVPEFEADLNISAMGFLPMTEAGDYYLYLSAEDANAAFVDGFGPASIPEELNRAKLFFALTDGSTFTARLRHSLTFFDGSEAPFSEQPMENIEGNQIPYSMYGVKDEETVSQLVAAFLEYRDTYCIGSS